MNTLFQSIPAIEGGRNSGNVANHYLIVFSPSEFEEFLKTTSVPAPENAVAPTEPPAIAVQNVFELASNYGIPVRLTNSNRFGQINLIRDN